VLDEPFVDVLLRFEALGPDRYEAGDDGLSVVGRRSGDRIALGDRVTLVIEDVALLRRTIYGRRVPPAQAYAAGDPGALPEEARTSRPSPRRSRFGESRGVGARADGADTGRGRRGAGGASVGGAKLGETRPGKRPGAFCAYTVPSHHPYVLLNWTSRPRDVATLAHELGHGLHAYLAREQGVFHQSTPLTLAEFLISPSHT